MARRAVTGDQADQAPGLAALEAAGAQLDAEAAATAEALPGAEAPPGTPPKDYAAEARELVTFAHGLFVPIYPRLAGVYTAEVRERLALAAAPVMEKYGFDLAALFGRWGPEIGLALAALPLVKPTMDAIRADRGDQARDQAPAAEAAPGPGAPVDATRLATRA